MSLTTARPFEPELVQNRSGAIKTSEPCTDPIRDLFSRINAAIREKGKKVVDLSGGVLTGEEGPTDTQAFSKVTKGSIKTAEGIENMAASDNREDRIHKVRARSVNGQSLGMGLFYLLVRPRKV